MTGGAAADALVLGAGGAGLFCAITAGRRGRRVIVVDHAARIGRKILISGGGRCNFTNRYAAPDRYVSRHPDFCRSALAAFPPDAFIERVEAAGIPYHEKKAGQLFCVDSAERILRMLLAGAEAAGVRILTGTAIRDVTRDTATGAFTADTTAGRLTAPRLVVATGGPSVPPTGATGFVYEIARRFDHAVIEPEPALVGLRWSDADRKVWGDLTGVAVPDAVVTVRGAAIREAVLLTHTGLSGPAILRASLTWRAGDSITIDLLPEDDARTWLRARRAAEGAATLADALAERLPKRFARRFADTGLPGGPLARLSDASLDGAAARLARWRIEPAGTEGFAKAEVTRGGVDTVGLSSKTMESRTVPGLHFIGEVVDVTGDLGGFNFQWAWSSGFACGSAL